MSDAAGGVRRLWLVILVILGLVGAGIFAGTTGRDPVVAVDEPLPDLPATTLSGERLDARFFGAHPWMVFVWLPG